MISMMLTSCLNKPHKGCSPGIKAAINVFASHLIIIIASNVNTKVASNDQDLLSRSTSEWPGPAQELRGGLLQASLSSLLFWLFYFEFWSLSVPAKPQQLETKPQKKKQQEQQRWAGLINFMKTKIASVDQGSIWQYVVHQNGSRVEDKTWSKQSRHSGRAVSQWPG